MTTEPTNTEDVTAETAEATPTIAAPFPQSRYHDGRTDGYDGSTVASRTESDVESVSDIK